MTMCIDFLEVFQAMSIQQPSCQGTHRHQHLKSQTTCNQLKASQKNFGLMVRIYQAPADGAYGTLCTVCAHACVSLVFLFLVHCSHLHNYQAMFKLLKFASLSVPFSSSLFIYLNTGEIKAQSKDCNSKLSRVSLGTVHYIHQHTYDTIELLLCILILSHAA